MFRRYINKYNNKKTIYNGIKFDSLIEMRRYTQLELLLKAGKISELELQKKYILLDKYKNGDNKTIRKIEYIADFKYKDNIKNKIVVEDVKGVKTEGYKLKKKLFESIYYPLTITEITKNNI